MQFVLFTFVIAVQFFPFDWFWETQITSNIFLSLLPRFRKHQKQSSVLFQRLPSLLFQFIGNDLVRLSAVVFTCVYDGRSVLPLLCTFCTKAVREGKSSALKWEVTIFKREIPPEHTGPLSRHCCTNTASTCFMIHFDAFVLSRECFCHKMLKALTASAQHLFILLLFFFLLLIAVQQKR